MDLQAFNPGPWELQKSPTEKTQTVQLNGLDSAIKTFQLTQHPKDADNYLKAAKPVIDSAIKSYAVTDSPAIRAKAKSIVLDAAGKFDPTKAKPRTYLLTHLQGLRRYSAQTTSQVRAPEQHLIDAGRIEKHLPDLKLELGREPSDSEVADRTGIPISRVARARYLPSSSSLGSVPENIRADPVKRTDSISKTWLNFIYHDLSPADQVIMEFSTGLHDKPRLSTTEIAAKLGVTPGAVSQRKKKIEEMMNEFDQYLNKR